MNVFATVKDHPYIAGAVVGGAVLLVYFATRGGTVDNGVTIATADPAGNAAYQAALVNAQLQGKAIDAAMIAEENRTAASLEYARIMADAQNNNYLLGIGLEEKKIAATKEISSLVIAAEEKNLATQAAARERELTVFKDVQQAALDQQRWEKHSLFNLQYLGKL